MWTPKGRAKSVHNSEVSTLVKLGVATLVKLGVAMGHRYKENKQAGQKVSTEVGCPQRWGVHRAGFYCTLIHII